MKTKTYIALSLSVILAFASGSNLFAAPSLDITKPSILSTMGGAGPPIDADSSMGQWFTNLTTGVEEFREFEFHDNETGMGGGSAGYGAIRGVVTSISYVAGPGTDIIAFEILATIVNDTGSMAGEFMLGDNSHGETNILPAVVQQITLAETKLVAEFAISEPGMFPLPPIPPYRDPGYPSFIIASNEHQWAWYCWNPTNEFGPGGPGDYYVPTWDFGDIPPGASVSTTLVFTVSPPMPPGPPPFGTPDPRYAILVASEAEGKDLFANRSTSLKISTWIDDLDLDMMTPYDEPVLRNSDVSVFHNLNEPGADWGDAPDYGPAFGYPTLEAFGGAYHVILDTNAAWLGHFWDAETNGIPSTFATGDDFDAENDEDGIVFTSALVPGSLASLDAIATTNGSYLQGWIDFYGNTNWTDAGEQIFTNVFMHGGPTSLVFSVPGGAVGGITYARFRLSTDLSVPHFGGPAPNGEVEDYLVIIDDGENGYDFGDAFDPTYPTYIGSAGAGHLVPAVPAVFLGASVDTEFNGQPNPTATGDDVAGATPDDEDGIFFSSDIIAGGVSTIDALGGPSGGLLDAWIDFNGDGDWFDPGEQIFISTPLTPGPNIGLPYTVPEPLNLGTNFARFRLSTAGGLLPYGIAFDGEVEDYEVYLYQPIPSPELTITNISFTVSNTVANIEWNTQSNILYQLQATTNLMVSNSWVDVESAVLGPVNKQSNSVTTSQRFYRVTAPWAK